MLHVKCEVSGPVSLGFNEDDKSSSEEMLWALGLPVLMRYGKFALLHCLTGANICSEGC